MALMDSLKSRFRGGDTKQKDNTPTPAPETEQPQPQPEKPAPPPPPKEPAELRVTWEHPLRQLWDHYVKRAEGADQPQPPAPSLSLEPLLARARKHKGPVRGPNGEPAVVLTEEEAEQELERLRKVVDQTASKRLSDYQEQQKIAAAKEAERAARAAKNGEQPSVSPTASMLPPPDMDAGIEVFLTARKMAAFLLIYPPSGKGMEVNKKMLERALGAMQVVSGVDEKLLNALSGRPDRYFTLHLIAVGKMPVHGKDGSVIDLFPRERVHKLKEDETTGRVDFAAIELFHNVHEGDMICRINYPTEPADGKTVTGQVLPGRPGRPPEIPKGRSTQLSEDRSRLIASCDGHVEFGGKTFQVKPVLDIGGNVDYSTGNINCVGDVHIHGDVCGGFSVKATGSITVDGVIEACSVETGGDLVVRKGVQGGGEAVLRVRKGLFAKYLESTVVYVRENLEAESLISCRVYSDGDVTARSGRGTIVGGEVYAAHDVSASIVGSPAELLTVVQLGGRPFEDFERAELVGIIESLEAELEKLDRQPDSPLKLQRMSKTRMLIAANKLKLRQLDKEIDEMDGDPAQTPGAAHGRLSAGVIWPGTEITIGPYILRVAHETHSCMTSVSDGEIVLI